MNADAINYATGVIGLILAVVGIVLTVKSIKKKEPVYSIKSVNVISDYSSKYKKLTVAYKDKIVENFTVSKILFYNRGSETITRQDIDTINPLTISSETCKILDASILQINKESNNFEVNLNRDNEYVYIKFDYLDKNQGAVIQVVHTGLSSDDLDIWGDIKGVQKLSGLPPKKLVSTNKFSITLVKTVSSILVGGVLIGIVIILNLSENKFLPLSSLNSIAIIAISLLISNTLAQTIIDVFSARIPKGLEKFDE